MAVAEATTNLVFAPITKLADVKASGNWMWAAKLAGEVRVQFTVWGREASLECVCCCMTNLISLTSFADLAMDD